MKPRARGLRQMSLLDGAAAPAGGGAEPVADLSQPLASRMRPETLDEVVGQRQLLGEGKALRRMIEEDRVPSMILWGPPGVGKTTLANVIAKSTKAEFVPYSAVTSGIKEHTDLMARAEQARRLGIRTVLFVDEIHRFNKAQQDAFLPYVEQGSVTDRKRADASQPDRARRHILHDLLGAAGRGQDHAGAHHRPHLKK